MVYTANWVIIGYLQPFYKNLNNLLTYTPENSHDWLENQPFENVSSKKNTVMFHCHVSFQGGSLWEKSRFFHFFESWKRNMPPLYIFDKTEKVLTTCLSSFESAWGEIRVWSKTVFVVPVLGMLFELQNMGLFDQIPSVKRGPQVCTWNTGGWFRGLFPFGAFRPGARCEPECSTRVSGWKWS